MAIERRPIRHERDRVNQLRAFCQVAKLGSTSGAADHLGLGLRAVALRVRELEEELELTLFNRSGGRLRLTRAGERLRELAMPLVEDMDSLFRDFREATESANRGRLTVAASVAGASFVLPSHVKRFRDLHPRVRMRILNRSLFEGLELLLDDEVELVLGANKPHLENAFQYRHLLDYRIVLIASPDHPLAGRSNPTPEEISRFASVVPPSGTSSRKFGDAAASRNGVEVRSVIEVGDWYALKRYVEMGFGFSMIPSMPVSPADRLSIIDLDQYFPTRSYGVFTRRDKEPSPQARAFLELLLPPNS